MTTSFVAAMRRANRLMHPARAVKAGRSMQKSMAGLMIQSATPKAGRALGSVLKQLRAAQAFLPGHIPAPARRPVAPKIPEGAKYLFRQHRGATGSRGYKLYIPASQPKRPKGLILMLHGCNQGPDDFAVGTHMNALAEKHGLAIAYPAQTKGHNAAVCWNWFKPGDQARDGGEPAILAAMTRKLAREFGLGRERVFVAGLSAGGAMASILIDVYPDVFSAAGIHSGLPRGAASDVLSAMSAMRSGAVDSGAPLPEAPAFPVRRILFQGDADSTVNPSNAALIVTAALGAGATPQKTVERSVRGRGYARSDFAGPKGTVALELWMIEGGGHAWSGGRVSGSYTDAKGPDASAQMVRFFLTSAA